MPVVNKLQLPNKQRFALLAVFALGSFVCIVSIIRMKSLVDISRSTDVSWSNPPAAEWSAIEVNVGIICASLPSLKATITRFFPHLFSSRNDSRDVFSSRKEGTRRLNLESSPGNVGRNSTPMFAAKKMPGFGSVAIATRTDSVGEMEMDALDGTQRHAKGANNNSRGINVVTIVEQEVEQSDTVSSPEPARSTRRQQYGAPVTPGAGDSDSDSEKGLFTPSNFGGRYINDFERYCTRQ